MKPQLLKVNTTASQSFSVRRDVVPYMNNRWHYHTEVELIHFEEGYGTQFVGDSIHHFEKGDVVLIGTNLPHYWRFDDCYLQEGYQKSADVRVAHFNEQFMGETFLSLPENNGLKGILEKARYGLQVKGSACQRIAAIMEQMLKSWGTRRIMLLIEALLEIANCEELNILSSVGFNPNFERDERDRINNIYDFALANFKRKVSLDEIADIAGISSNSFCRYFRSRTGKTFSRFLIEIRVGYACKLLIENKMNVKQICYESGFNNFASFHKYFKQITGKSPLTYQKTYLSAQS
ncbi:AraC-type DNA-binding protein [bacterium A37T11]|nr:AraC-type DNA-binding protein [bacterium A37T11]